MIAQLLVHLCIQKDVFPQGNIDIDVFLHFPQQEMPDTIVV